MLALAFLEMSMRIITKRPSLGQLAIAELDGFVSLHFKKQRLEFAAVVRAVAERTFLGMLAVAERDTFFLGNLKLQRCELRAFVRAVTEWLLARQPAATPEVAAWLDFKNSRGL